MKLNGLKLRDLWWFSLPSIIASVFEPLASVVDTALVGRVSATSLAALALCAAVFNAITWVFNFLVHTSTQSVADSSAQRDPELLKQRIKISLSVALLVGLVCSVCLYLPSRFWFSFIGGKAELWEEFNQYFRPRAIFHSLTILSVTILSILRGFSELKLVLRLMIFSTLINIFLSWLFLYPMKMGLAGAAYGTITSHFLVAIIGLYFLLNRVGLQLHLRDVFSFDLPRRQLFKFGKNSSSLFTRSLLLTGCFFISTRLASFVGVKELAAHQVLLQVWLLSSFFLDGLAISGNILGARFFFAGKRKITKIVFDQLIVLGLFVGLAFTVIFSLLWTQIIGLFTSEPEVIGLMMALKWPIVLSQVISAIAFVYDGLIFGLDGFSYLAKHMLIGTLLFYLPIALYTLMAPKLFWIWMGLVLLNVYRAYSGFRFVSKKI